MSQPIAVACAVIERDGCVLVAQRPPGKSLGLKWEFPGGKIEANESGEAALVREIHEELGIAIAVDRALPEVVHDYGAFSIRLVPFVCRLLSGEPHPHEHVAIQWRRPADLDTLDLAAADVPVLRDYLATLKTPRPPRAH